jgi:hypothetical protein
MLKIAELKSLHAKDHVYNQGGHRATPFLYYPVRPGLLDYEQPYCPLSVCNFSVMCLMQEYNFIFKNTSYDSCIYIYIYIYRILRA